MTDEEAKARIIARGEFFLHMEERFLGPYTYAWWAHQEIARLHGVIAEAYGRLGMAGTGAISASVLLKQEMQLISAPASSDLSSNNHQTSKG